MSGNSEPTKFKNPVLNWIEFRLPIISYFQKETWHHTNGCRLWLEVERSTITHEIKSVKACHPQIDKITKNIS